jgi:anti-sigma-K factor RskA
MNDELDMLAAEYVLGTLSPAERASFEKRVASEEEAKRAVDEWNRRLAPLALAAGEVEPPARLWRSIERQMQPPSPREARPVTRPAANDNAVDDLRRSLTGWRRAFIAASALAASLAAFVVYRELPAGRRVGGIYVAMMSRPGERPAIIVNADPASKSAYVIPISTEVPAGRSLELWFIGSGERPISMGLIKPQAAHLTLPAGAKIENASLAVSVEPEGGSPSGAPTGQVIYSGQLVRG